MTSQEAQSRMRRYARYLAYHSGDMLTAKHIPHYTAINEVKHYLRQHSRDDAPRGRGNKAWKRAAMLDRNPETINLDRIWLGA